METHALAVLKDAESWEWPPSQRIQKDGGQRGKNKANTAKLLSCLISESKRFSGSLMLDQFWKEVGSCDARLKANIDKLRENPELVPPSRSLEVLFEGIDRKQVNFEPVRNMASEFYTHLGIAFMNHGGAKSGDTTSHSVSSIVEKETDDLLRDAEADPKFGQRKQATLTDLAFRRDGDVCVITGLKFDRFPGGEALDPILAHLIPHSFHDKSSTLKCIAMFAGDQARDLVMQFLNRPGNIFNLESNAHTAFDNLKWGIEAQDDNGTVKYIYRRVPKVSHVGPGLNKLRDGDEIEFGKGKEGAKLGGGPLPLLCNVHLAITRVLKMSGAAEAIAQLKEDADDSDFPHVFLASDYFCNILDAKLLLQGVSQKV